MKPGLAVDYMSFDDLWLKIWEELYWLDPETSGSITRARRTQAWRQMRACLRELHVRGIQISLQLGKEEEKPRSGDVYRGIRGIS
jgi:hypothetical protein